MDDLTLGDKIRAMKTGSLSSYGQGIDEGLDRAAALADEHQAETDALVAAAYEDAAGIDPAIFDHPSVYMGGPSRQARRTAEMVAKSIRARVPADAAAALDRIKAEAHRAGMREAAGICERIRIAIANGPMPEGARFDYEQAILAAAEKEAGNG